MKKVIAVVAIVAAAIAIATLILSHGNNSVIPPQTNSPSTPSPAVTTTLSSPSQGKHYDIGLSENVGVKEAH
ncbi:MAG TPA: hypothetical protein VGR54_03805 [Nitrosopumilaceae archaeon]|nr:hypothetical protein [Nitrosopumilaceae archaeon]